ncbi:MAG: hypothetical protein ACKVJG_24525 [Candidatus Latescibacterota bacterium]|jgi:hypothetical protein
MGQGTLRGRPVQKSHRQLAHVKPEFAEYQEARELVSACNFFTGKKAFDRHDWSEAIKYLNIVRSTSPSYKESRSRAKKAHA